MKSTLTDPAPAQRMTFYLLLAATLVLNLIDLAITLHWTAQFGPTVESNPIMAWLLIRPVLFVAYKLVIPTVYILIVIRATRKHFKLAFWGTVYLFVLYCLIVGWNVVDSVKAVMVLRGF